MLTQDSIKNKNDMLELVKKYDIKGFGFNILMSDEKIADSHYQKTSEFLIEMFKGLRKLGIYEDRMMRGVIFRKIKRLFFQIVQLISAIFIIFGMIMSIFRYDYSFYGVIIFN